MSEIGVLLIEYEFVMKNFVKVVKAKWRKLL